MAAFYSRLKYATICGTCRKRLHVGDSAIRNERGYHHPACVPDRIPRKSDPSENQLSLAFDRKTTRVCIYDLGGWSGSWKNDPRYVYVGRGGGKFGNPATHLRTGTQALVIVGSVAEAVDYHRRWLDGHVGVPGLVPPTVEEIRGKLTGKILVCYCKTTAICHADNYIKIIEG